MPQSLARILIHTVFSTKDRVPYMQDPEVRAEMHNVLGGTAKRLDCKPIRIGGTADHAHLLTALARTVAPAEFVKEVKRVSTNWIKEREDYSGFHWQAGYGCFSIGQSQVRDVCDYIAGQNEHHQKTSFQDEFRAFLRRYEIEYDERYVWDSRARGRNPVGVRRGLSIPTQDCELRSQSAVRRTVRRNPFGIHRSGHAKGAGLRGDRWAGVDWPTPRA